MLLEDRFKQVLGEFNFTNVALQHQIEELRKELEKLKNERDLRTSDSPSI